MTRPARLFATRSARVQNVKCNVNKPNALNARSTVNNRNAQFVARKTCVKKTRARNARLFALRLNVTPLVLPRKRTALRYVRKLRARGRAPNQPPARVQNVNCNALNRLVTLKTNSVVAVVVQKALNVLWPLPRVSKKFTAMPK